MLEKVAWAYVRDGRLLVARNHGRTLFHLPGDQREPGETDARTLVREVDEELGVRIDPATMRHVGIWLARRDGLAETFRLICYTADHRGTPAPRAEIAELAWFTSADRDRGTEAERCVLDALQL